MAGGWPQLTSVIWVGSDASTSSAVTNSSSSKKGARYSLMSWARADSVVLVPADWRNARMTRADCSTAAMPLPRTSPTRNRTRSAEW